MVDEIKKAIELVELKADLEQLVGQANAVAGAINYVRAKMALLEKQPEKPIEPTKGVKGEKKNVAQ